jgi:hypothetical protein
VKLMHTMLLIHVYSILSPRETEKLYGKLYSGLPLTSEGLCPVTPEHKFVESGDLSVLIFLFCLFVNLANSLQIYCLLASLISMGTVLRQRILALF